MSKARRANREDQPPLHGSDSALFLRRDTAIMHGPDRTLMDILNEVDPKARRKELVDLTSTYWAQHEASLCGIMRPAALAGDILHTTILVGEAGELGRLPFRPHTYSGRRLAQLVDSDYDDVLAPPLQLSAINLLTERPKMKALWKNGDVYSTGELGLMQSRMTALVEVLGMICTSARQTQHRPSISVVCLGARVTSLLLKDFRDIKILCGCPRCRYSLSRGVWSIVVDLAQAMKPCGHKVVPESEGVFPIRVTKMPHPSGVSRWWNLKSNFDSARFLMDSARRIVEIDETHSYHCVWTGLETMSSGMSDQEEEQSRLMEPSTV